MKNCVLFRYREKGQPEPYETGLFDGVLAQHLPDCKITNVYSIDQFLKVIRVIKHDLIIFDWSGYKSPTEVVELYFQSKFARSPMLAYYRNLTQKEKNFLKEYNVLEGIEIADPNKEDFYLRMVALIKKVFEPKDTKRKIRLFKIRIFYFLNNGKYDKAQVLLDKLKPHLTPIDLCFFEAQFLKKQLKFDEAIKLITSNPSSGFNLTSLLGSLYFHAKQYKKSIDLLTKAQRVSSLNLRRRFLIGRCYEEISKEEPVYRKEAMTTFLELLQIAPTYPDVTGRIIKFIISMESIEKIPLVESLIQQMSEKDITKVFKKIKTFKDPFKTAFRDSFVQALSRRANSMIQQDDHGALRLYKYIGKLVPDEDSKRHMVLDYCTARAYFRFGQLETAKELNDKIITESGGKYDKAISLGKLIDKALKGEFDVLVDDEKDWLIRSK